MSSSGSKLPVSQKIWDLAWGGTQRGLSMQLVQNRRRFLATASLACAAGLLGASKSVCAEPPPETTTIRLAKIPGICIAPQYMAEELLLAEGFTDVRYVPMGAGIDQA